MRVDLFDFELPEELIALRPAVPRDAARLLDVNPGGTPPLGDRSFSDLEHLLRPGDLLVFNDTRVIPARLLGRRIRQDGAAAGVEITLHLRRDGSTWQAFAKPAKRLKIGDRITFGGEGRVCLLGTLDATVAAKGEGGEVTLSFDFYGPALDEAILALGDMPLPPYIASKRPTDAADEQDYQTVYAREPGAVAAPTAGLHFTQNLIKRLQERGVLSTFVTLHVGAGTFLPVKSDDTKDHRMHAEWGHVGEDTVAAVETARAAGGRIIAVGTTVLRLIESAAANSVTIAPFSGTTEIFITPGYQFKVADLLITNFHLPRSTLFMLVSAFSGLDVMKQAYAHAIGQKYRFYSYGDACLLHRNGAGA